MSMDSIADKVLAAYNRLWDIAQQVRSASAVTDKRRQLAKRLTAASELLSDEATDIAEDVGEEPKVLFALADKLAEYASTIGPKAATELWKAEDVKKELAGLLGMINAGWTEGILTAEQVAVVHGIDTEMAKTGGLRGPRTVADAIEGRATRVLLTDASGASIGKGNGMRGNAAQSITNLAAKLADEFGITDKKSDAYKVVTEYARQACNGDTVSVEYEGKTINLTPVYTVESSNGE